jgi:uncharacterized protein
VRAAYGAVVAAVAVAAGMAAVAVAVAAVAVVTRRAGSLGIGLGWRPELDVSVARLPGLDFVEVVAENLEPRRLRGSLVALRDRGTPIVPHGIGMSLGGADPPEPKRLRHMSRIAEVLDAPLVSEHLAFVRAGGLESGHLLPVARTREALDVVCANVERAQAALPVPLAVENVAAIVEWPGSEMSEAEFITRIVERTGVRLLVDVANLYANERNFGSDARHAIAELPLDAIAYVHVAGGVDRGGVYHDTHAHAVPVEVFALLTELCMRSAPPGVLLEYDRAYPSDADLTAELAAVRAVVEQAHV